jgi:hypothetical protein
MKVLTVKNPWAYLILYSSAFGHKDVENRTWETKYRGPLLIHCSKSLDANFPQEELPYGVNWQDFNGRIIGRVNLVDCVRNSKSLWAEKGMWHWVLRNPVPLKNPVPARGSLGLWNYEANYG